MSFNASCVILFASSRSLSLKHHPAKTRQRGRALIDEMGLKAGLFVSQLINPVGKQSYQLVTFLAFADLVAVFVFLVFDFLFNANQSSPFGLLNQSIKRAVTDWLPVAVVIQHSDLLL